MRYFENIDIEEILEIKQLIHDNECIIRDVVEHATSNDIEDMYMEAEKDYLAEISKYDFIDKIIK